MRSRINFLRQYIRSPGTVGAVTPSSKELAAKMLDPSSIQQADVILELGPGTGAITSEIVDRIDSSSRFLALEMNPEFVLNLKRDFQSVEVIEGSATELNSILKNLEVNTVDLVISGLPWAAFPDKVQEQILSEVAEILRDGGRFVTFAYSGIHLFPKARAFRNRLKAYFSTIERSQVAWSNVPPAFAYHCIK